MLKVNETAHTFTLVERGEYSGQGLGNTTCQSNYSVMNIIIAVKSLPSSKLKGYHKLQCVFKHVSASYVLVHD